MKVVEPDDVLGQLDGAQVVDTYVEDESGLHIEFADGRILIIAGTFVIAVQQADKKRLH